MTPWKEEIRKPKHGLFTTSSYICPKCNKYGWKDHEMDERGDKPTGRYTMHCHTCGFVEQFN